MVPKQFTRVLLQIPVITTTWYNGKDSGESTGSLAGNVEHRRWRAFEEGLASGKNGGIGEIGKQVGEDVGSNSSNGSGDGLYPSGGAGRPAGGRLLLDWYSGSGACAALPPIFALSFAHQTCVIACSSVSAVLWVLWGLSISVFDSQTITCTLKRAFSPSVNP